jgi:uncharacterized protein (DUF1697 family)
MTRYAALLRGINVGGKNKLPMKELAAMFESAGARDVATFIHSGNVVFRASPSVAATLPALVGQEIVSRFGFEAPIVMRAGSELQRIVRANPFVGVDEDELAIMFLAVKPSPERLQKLDPARSPPDQFVVRGRDIYLRLPNGFARTKLTNAWFDSKLSTVSTARNWRTLIKLRDLALAA